MPSSSGTTKYTGTELKAVKLRQLVATLKPKDGLSHDGCFVYIYLFLLLCVSLLVAKLHVELPCPAGITPYGVRGIIACSGKCCE